VTPLDEQSFLLFGLGITNVAAARALAEHGLRVVLADDREPSPMAAALADELGQDIHVGSVGHDLSDLVASVDAVLPTPGLPERHELFSLARSTDRPVLSEFDLAAAWDDRPVLAVTGTNGKTTVTTLVHEMLQASGVTSAAVGNLEVPLVAAIEDRSIERFVVEASSFRLAHSRRFAPSVGTWLNFAPDHLDVHTSIEAYRWAKAAIWAHQGPTDVAVVNADDPVVLAAEPDWSDRPAIVRFALDPTITGSAPSFHEADGVLVAADGVELVAVAELHRDLPHDRSNALAAAATALAGGASIDGVRTVLRSFGGLPHRVELVSRIGDVAFYDDSKATAPHATIAAVRGFPSVVLIAGGRNKGLDLSGLSEVTAQVRAVVGIGESASEVLAAFGDRPGRVATSMGEAVRAAHAMARPGDVVLLSPGCASFDWYGSYGERGDHFRSEVEALVLEVPT